MVTRFRQPEILEIARTEGKVTVEDLARRFNVTVQTIRRDLSDLADSGRLTRVHGGAVLASTVQNIGYSERNTLNAEAKERIAAACAADIPNDCALFLNIGTTTEAVARALLRHTGLLVITNNINVANILSANPEAEVMLTGGTLRRSDGGLVGQLAVESVRQFKVDRAVIGCSALDASGDLLDFDLQEIAVSRTILAQARHSVLVADASKFTRRAPARIASLADLDAVYTDAPLPGDLEQRCAEWHTAVHVT